MGFPYDFLSSPMVQNVAYAGMREAIVV